MDLREIARSQRRRQVLDVLQFERDREAALSEQLNETATELEGSAVDEEAFARMAPEDVDIVRQALLDTGQAFNSELGGEPGEDWLEEFRVTEDDSGADEREERLAEVARLEREIEESRRRQLALERYVEALARVNG